MRLRLPDVTLVIIETRCHELARLAVEDCLKHVEFGDVLICTDNHAALRVPGAACVKVEDWPDKIGWSQYHWHGAPQYIKTGYALFIQWDSWVIDPGSWRDEFLNCDYIGAPWWYKDGLNVGNGGFSLRSKRLSDFIMRHADVFPVTTSADDDLFCRHYRRTLEQNGFRWASDDLAVEFAFEWTRKSISAPSFGFHAIFNWPFVLDQDRLLERLRLANANKYIAGTRMMEQVRMGITGHQLLGGLSPQ